MMHGQANIRDLIISVVTEGSLTQHTVKLSFSSVVHFSFLTDVCTFCGGCVCCNGRHYVFT